jgi:hypothetical protein
LIFYQEITKIKIFNLVIQIMYWVPEYHTRNENNKTKLFWSP